MDATAHSENRAGAYPGDRALAALLRRAGARLGASAVREVVAGVIAAPPALDPDGWMVMVTPSPAAALKKALRALKAEMAASYSDGLSADAPDSQRLKALRAELKRRKLDGFIVPHADEHQGEYLPRQAERLAWLTGFTGSAGTAVVLKNHAAIFVDGRYTLQAGKEVDAKAFEIRHVSDTRPDQWITANLKPKGRLGYNPWLVTPNQMVRYRKACGQAGGHLAACADDPVDKVWRNQPPPPLSPIYSVSDTLAGKTAAEKCREIAAGLAAENLDAAFITAPESIAWLLNLRGGDVPYAPLALAFAVAHQNAKVDLFVDSRKLTAAMTARLQPGVRIHPPGALGQALDRLGSRGRAVRLDPDGAPAWVYGRLKKAKAAVQLGPDPCLLPKAKKNASEIRGIRRAHKRDGAALTRFLAWIDGAAASGEITELAAAEKLEHLRRDDARFRGLSFCTISGAGPNGAIVHYRVTHKTNRRLMAGSLYLVDSGAQYPDGTTDVTRTIAIGRPTTEMREHFTLVLKGHVALAAAVFPEGTTGAQLDALARRDLWRAGLDYDHGTGHGVGSFLSVHEGPQRISKSPSTVALEPGMVVSNEPGYYRKGAYGIRIENLQTVVRAAAPKGAERKLLEFEALTLAPIDLRLVVSGMLTAEERTWLNAYHARVRREIAPRVDPKTAAWLRKAARPLR